MKARRWIPFALGWGLATLGAWEVEWSDPVPVPGPTPAWPHFEKAPQAPISVVSRATYQIFFWPGPSTYRCLGTGLLSLQPPGLPVFGEGTREGQGWLLAVQKRGQDQWIALWIEPPVRPEADAIQDRPMQQKPASLLTRDEAVADPPMPDSSAGIRHGIRLATSDDEGRTWNRDSIILTPPEAVHGTPSSSRSPQWGLPWLVRSVEPAHWYCVIPSQGSILVARSEKEIPSVGTWKKWNGQAFASPGLGGPEQLIDLGPHGPVEGLSLHLNTALKQWVMVWHRETTPDNPEGGIWISFSADLLEWTTPKRWLAAGSDQRLWHPTLLGLESRRAGESAVLIYGREIRGSAAHSGPVMRTVRWIIPQQPENEAGRLSSHHPRDLSPPVQGRLP